MSSAESKRFEIAYTGINGPMMKTLGIGPGRGYVIVTPGDLIVKMGWAFSGTIPRSRITSAEASTKPQGYGWGVHGWNGKWVINGSDSGIVKIEIDPATTVRTLIFPINLRELYVSLENPESFLEALGPLAQP
jgi:hypothetical protein